MSPYFFRVEHDLLRSESFRTLGGSAIKVYLVIGLYSDFGTDWAYPSIRTIARQAGLSRQTVLVAVEELGGWASWPRANRRGDQRLTRSSDKHRTAHKARARQEGKKASHGERDWS